jgi:hypothetical protein
MRRRVATNRVAALSIAILVALVALTISGLIAATVSATETRSLTSSADTQIVENAPTKNYGAATSLGVNENDQSSIGKDKFALVKWDLSGIAPRTQINSASVTLNVTNSSTETYQAHVLKKPWVESAATWNVYSSGELWEVAGAKGSLDKEATVSGSITPSVKGKNTLTLPLAVVQGWVDNPDTNQGIIIAYPSSTRGFNFNSREDTDPTQRPQLILDLSPDTTPPETTIDPGPSGTISSRDVSFTFSSSEAGSRLECSLDSAAYTECTSPMSLTGLSDGPHTFSVKATDAAGNTDASPPSTTWTVDTVAPETTIDTKPTNQSNNASPSFDFSSNEANSTFQCSLDGAAFTSCSSPKSLSNLSDGSHTFAVKATDAAGNTDASPPSTIWTVDTTAPETTIDSGPSGTISVAEATFAYSSEEGDTFECSIDGAPYSACTSPKTKSYTKLSNGSHAFDVRATDGAGNVDATPASRTFSVEVPPPPQGTIAPETTIDSGPSGTVSTSSADFSFSATEDGSTFECSLDGSAFEPCSSPQSYTHLSEGSHSLEVKATDQGSNTDATPASRIWTVDTTSPETTIDSGPADGAILSSGDASFTFSASEAGSTFECTLDGAAFASCTSPKDDTGLSESLHTFSVRAKDGAGNVDPTPAIRHYSVEVHPPDVDGDTVPDSSDNCPLDPNASQADQDAGFDNDTNSNGTTKGNVCDPDNDTPATDADGDGVVDSSDKCAGHDDAADVDGDGTPDGCDTQDNRDPDGDGLQNYQDQCPDQAGPASNNGCPLPARVDVTDFGATSGDGTDDTQEFLNALKSAVSQGAHAYVPPGTYHLAGLDIPDSGFLEVEGSPIAKAVIKKFGTSSAPVFTMQGTANTSFAQDTHVEGVNGRFTLDLSGATQNTTGFRLRGVKNFSIKNFHEIGRANDNTGTVDPNASILRPVISFLPVDTTKLNNEYEHPHNGLIENVTVENQAFGWGLTQLTGAEDVHFQDISGEGGSTLRLENFENNATTIDDVTADNVTCINGNNPVMLNPHNADNGDVHVTDVTANGCWRGVRLADDPSYPNGNFDATSTIDRVTVIPGSQAQKNDPNGPLNSWLVGPSDYCVDSDANLNYSNQITNLNCRGLPNRNWPQ